MISKIHAAVGKFVTKDDSIAAKLDPAFKIDTSNAEQWDESLLQRLIRERRLIPKEERLAKFRNDSVDEVDTTDLENWNLKFRGEAMVILESDPDDDEMDFKFLDEPEDEIIDYHSDKKLIKNEERLMIRHRLDLAKLYLQKDGGYTLRKFKRIFKREMAEFPDRYEILKPEEEESEDSDSDAEEEAAVVEGADAVEGEEEKEVPEIIAKSDSGDEAKRAASGSDDESAEPAEPVDPEAEKLKLREKIKKEIDEMNADSEEEHYEFEEEELEQLLLKVEEMEFFTEEEAQAFLEKQHAAI